MDDFSEKLIALIAEGKAKQYNPICVYGKRYQVERFSERVQLACLRAAPGTRICCFPGDAFAKQIILSMRGRFENVLRERLRLADMLIITGIDEIQGREASMWEFYSLFDYYYEQGKMIIIGSSVPYSELYCMEDRVMTQLQGGLILDLNDED